MRHLSDALLVAGSVLLVVGASLAWSPAGWFVAGGLLLVWGVVVGELDNGKRANDAGDTGTA